MREHRHIFGMRIGEAVCEVTRILRRLGFSVKLSDSVIEASRDSDYVKVSFREVGKGVLGVTMTEVIFHCGEGTHAEIVEKIMYLRCGG